MNLMESRKKINEIDEEITKLFEKRMELVKEVIAYKKANNLPILDQNREEEVIAHVTSLLINHDLDNYLKIVFEKLMEVSKEYQRGL